jgi:hypothetical protein
MIIALWQLTVSQWRTRKLRRQLRKHFAEVGPPAPPARETPPDPRDCPWCSPGWRSVSGVDPRDCCCDRDCGASDCRMLPVRRDS